MTTPVSSPATTTRAAIAPADRPAGEPAFRWSTLLVVLTGTFMTFLDFFVVNVALPSVQSDLGASQAAVQLVVAGYAVTFSVGMIGAGRLGDSHGRRRVFAAGLGLFTLASTVCGLAPDVGTLVVARMVQGAAGALMTPQVLGILGTAYAGRQQERAFAAYGVAMGAAGVLGQLVGGVLIQVDLLGTGWRSIFLLNLPVGVAALLAVTRLVPESHGRRGAPDVVGTSLLTAGLVAVILPLVEGRDQGWPVWTWAVLACAPVLVVAFVLHQRGRCRAGRAPLVDLGLFTDRAFTVGSLAGLAFGAVPAGFFFVLALYLQQGRHLSPAESGTVFTAVGAGYFLALRLAPALAVRLHTQVLAAGSLAVAAGCLLLGLDADAGSAWALAPGLAVVGLGIGAVLVPLTSTVLARTAPEHAGTASGVLATAQQVGGALGVTVLGCVFFGALGEGDYVHAFVVSVVVLAGLTLLTTGVVQLLPRRPRG